MRLVVIFLASLFLTVPKAEARESAADSARDERGVAVEGLTGPAELTPAAFIAADKNLALWRNSERARRGPAAPLSNEVQRAWHADATKAARSRGNPLPPPPALPREDGWLPEVRGYFAVVNDQVSFARRGTIFAGGWRDGASSAGAPSAVTLRLAAGELACGLRDIRANIGDVAYLGPRWNDGWLRVSAQLAQGSAMPTQGPILTEGLEITRRPHSGDATPLYPERARKSGRIGLATPVCHIGAQGALNCGHGGETPGGFGFSEAAVTYTTMIQVEPTLADGRPSNGACVRIRVPFRLL